MGHWIKVVNGPANKTPAALAKFGLSGATAILVRLEQYVNASYPMFITFWGIVMLRKEAQDWNT